MYDELIKDLRENHDKYFARDMQVADAIEDLQKDLKRSKDFEEFWQHEAEEALKKFQVAISNKPRWIPVTERLPEKEGSVLIFSELGGIAEGHYSHMYEVWVQYRWNVKDIKVSYWMPLPQPPESDGE